MIGLFRDLLQRFVRFGIELAAALIRGLLGGLLGGVKVAGGVDAIEVRRAEADEVVDVRHRVLRAGRPRQDAIWDGDREPDARHWVAVRGARVVGAATVLNRPFPDADAAGSPPEPRPRWQLRGMATDADLQGTGVGRQVLAAVEREVGPGLWCNARRTAVRFYEKAGWKVVSGEFDVAGIGPHVRMTR